MTVLFVVIVIFLFVLSSVLNLEHKELTGFRLFFLAIHDEV